MYNSERSFCKQWGNGPKESAIASMDIDTLIYEIYLHGLLNIDAPQVLNLGRSLYVWVSTSSAMNNLALALPSALQPDPAATQLLNGTKTSPKNRIEQHRVVSSKKKGISWVFPSFEVIY